MPDDQEWLVDEIVWHEWAGKQVKFWVNWTAGDFTWESPAALDELSALDDYFEANGVTRWQELPHSAAHICTMLDRRAQFVCSAKNVFYPGPEVGSHWVGPADNRVWVPGLDWPEGIGAPPDPEATSAPIAGPPPPFQGVATPRNEMPPPGINTHLYGVYTGPFANTMHQRDRALEHQRDGHRHGEDYWHGGERRRSDEHLREEVHHRRDERGWRQLDKERFLRDPTGPRRDDHRRAPPSGPDRTREQQLWEQALHSKGTPSGRPKIQVTRPVRDVDSALHRENRHPILSLGTTPDVDESDYGSSEAEEQSELQKFRTREQDRLSKALAKKGGAPVTDPLLPAPQEAGLWECLPVDSIPDARNLVWWWSHGCPRARTFAKFLINVANQGFIMAATGDSTPISRRDPRSIPHQDRHKRTQERLWRADHHRSGTSETPTTALSFDLDDAMESQAPPANPVPLFLTQQSYAGTSPTPPPSADSMTAHWLGPQISLHAAMAHAATQRPIDWVRGVRTDEGMWPSADTPTGMFPNGGDMRAAHLLHFLAPPLNCDGSVHCDAWMNSVLQGLLVWGFFECHIQFGEWVAGRWALEAYPFDAINVTYSQSLQWLHWHGVDRASQAAMELHSFAASRRNLEEGQSTPGGQRFVGHGVETTESVLRLDTGQVTQWEMLCHGPLRAGLTSATPRRPANVPAQQAPNQQGDAEMVPAENPADVPPQQTWWSRHTYDYRREFLEWDLRLVPDRYYISCKDRTCTLVLWGGV
ncbi:hypothetical protein K438DRAFT_2109820 [Mycena galopus ATCC 62051]|nr:hypothetical protein K438DRAFT_2109820 [Mycena galopus ATCC 62051]